MQFISVHVIAFFMAIMMMPKDVNQFTIDVQGKKIEWTRQETGWHAVELPRDDAGIYSVKGTEVTITGEGHKLKTNISRFLTLPDDLDWKKAAEIQVALKSLGDPVQIQREEGKIVLSQAKGGLFEKPVTIIWKKSPAVSTGLDSKHSDAMDLHALLAVERALMTKILTTEMHDITGITDDPQDVIAYHGLPRRTGNRP